MVSERPGSATPSELTVLSSEETGGLGVLRLHHPPGTFRPTPATRITLEAVGREGEALEGVGLDWGCGIGVLSIAAARIPGVEHVWGTDLAPANVAAARLNARLNAVEDRTGFIVADSLTPLEPEAGAAGVAAVPGAAAGAHAADGSGAPDEKELVERFREACSAGFDFLVANPPAYPGGDGFDFRRLLLRDAGRVLKPGAPVLLQALSAYGAVRVRGLERDAPGFVYEGVALRTPLVPFGRTIKEVRTYLRRYAAAEEEGQPPYEFFADPRGEKPVNARVAARILDERGAKPWARWQVHRLRWRPS
ncbi:MAG: 50S ribosomal protein L11 methyltransferase [Gemmatimonadota bacterium]